ncbi:MAG: hypothetical protein Edafosvirus4_15 [Edafosvirus sp.]|uniref:Uncharacterized protein n=1 Tax=Edafosvirus sp. TaxID=2487765 RepID=A0A3G4ZVK8_9VIRU|nr:MAG: hypothetical protein Edafosvirus4_15 [Edafosvirus sp.]
MAEPEISGETSDNQSILQNNDKNQILTRKELCCDSGLSMLSSLGILLLIGGIVTYSYFLAIGHYELIGTDSDYDQVISKTYNHVYKKMECVNNNTIKYSQCSDIDHVDKISIYGYCCLPNADNSCLRCSYEYQNKSTLDYNIGYQEKWKGGTWSPKGPTIMKTITIECNGQPEQIYNCSTIIKQTKIWCYGDKIYKCHYPEDILPLDVYFLIFILSIICFGLLWCSGCIFSYSCISLKEAIWYKKYVTKKQNEYTIIENDDTKVSSTIENDDTKVNSTIEIK